MHHDVFNGDADGICALHQLRLFEPVAGELITGVKRDIGLLQRVSAQAGDRVTVLDIAVGPNAEALACLLARGVRVRWFDHHEPGGLPAHALFEAHLDTAADVCTSLLVDRHVGGRYRAWAVVAAFGDNLGAAARRAAAPLGLDEPRLAGLRELGECLNYNGYGERTEDLHFHPADLYRHLHAFADPDAFIREAPEFAILREGRARDMALARAMPAIDARSTGAVFILPDAAWARRVSGSYANVLADEHPRRAHAVLTPSSDGHYVVSVRAPLADPVGADVLCGGFDRGGGRKAAAGINGLPMARTEAFIRAFFGTWPG